MGRSWDKFRLLMWKNWLIQWRERKQTVLEIAIPVVFSALLVIIRTLVDVELVTEPTTFDPFSPNHLPLHNLTIPSNDMDGSMADNLTIPEEFQDKLCKIITTGNLNLKFEQTDSFSDAFDQSITAGEILQLLYPTLRDFSIQKWFLAYSPKTALTKRIMNNAQNSVPFLACGLDNSTALQDFLYLPNQFRIAATTIFLAGAEFDDTIAKETILPNKVKIKLRFPAERRVSRINGQETVEQQQTSGDVNQLNWMTGLLFPEFQTPGPRNKEEKDGGAPGYYNEGFLGVQKAISDAILQERKIKLPNIELQRFPYPSYIDDPLLQAMEGLVPMIIVLSFVYSAIYTVKAVTSEKEKQLKESMKMMGLPSWLHWSAWFLKTLLLFCVSIILITLLLTLPLAGKDMYVFAETDWSCLLVFLFCYMIASITFCFAISSFFAKANTAAVVGGLIWFLCYFPYVFFQRDYSNTPLSTKLGISVFSNTAMSYGFQIILMYEGTGAGLQWSNLWTPVTPNDTLTMGHIMGMLIIDAIIYMVIAVYVEGIYPGEFGVPLPWYFPFSRSYWFGEQGIIEDGEADKDDESKRDAFEPEPRNRTSGVRIKNLRKVYSNGKVAVHGLSLNMYEGQITVLLGHNGAGKTTTMSMLTGMYTPTSGTATINGHDIRTDMDSARESLGLCPQHNILFDQLTVKEHLDFFGKLKGLTGKALEAETSRFIEMLELVNKTNSPSSSLSGGMKRKLAAAVALCGGSKVVLFDEPTSGMDPAARRALWDLLQAEKHGRTLLLTTHFMDEADLLGDRIAIMSEGRLQTCGSSYFLKKRYGGGYQIIMVKDDTCDPEKVTQVLSEFIPGISPTADIGAELSYHLEDSQQHLFEPMFNAVELRKSELGISSYGVSLTTMEEVFMKVGSEHEVGKTEDDISEININGNDHAKLTIEPVKLLENPKLFVNQTLAMFIKNATSTYRSWLLYLIIVIIPVLTLSIAILVGRAYSTGKDLPGRLLTLQDYKDGVVAIQDLSDDPDLVATYLRIINGDSGSIRDLNKMQSNLNVSEYILQESIKDVGDVSQKFILGTTFEKDKITAMFNNQPLHTPPLALSYVYNAFLQYYGSKDYKLEFINEPLPYTVTSKVLMSQQGGTMGFQIAFNLGFSFAFVVSYYVVFYIRERMTKAKHLQFVSGINVPTFWFIAYVWDLLVSLGPLIAIILTLLAFQEDGFKTAGDLGRTFVIMICSMFGNLPLTYLASFWFAIPATGFSQLIMIHVFTGVATFIVVTVMKTPSLDLIDVAEALDWVFTFLPTYSLTTSFQNMNANYQYLNICDTLVRYCDTNPNVCCKEKGDCGGNDCLVFSENYFAWEQPGVGRNVAFFFVVAAILIVLLLLTELRVFEMISYNIAKKKYKPVATPWKTTDSDVTDENQKIAKLSQEERKQYNLLLDNVSKFYKSFQAVNNLNLGVKQGECFGLLGVNGAGKTTTFKMLTGDEMISTGDAFVRGLSLKYETKKVFKLIGYCPQFDALLDDLTGRETLRIFCLLRGVPAEEIPHITEKLAKELLFYAHIDKKVKEYSGGNKRKLSTAVALVGDPPVIYLDEPTTGMDPVAKRHLWNVICKIRDEGKTIILTSHSMEECEALCTRLAIMVNGEFLCLGSTQHLKSKYAEGYTLTIKVEKPSADDRPQNRRSSSSIRTRKPSLTRMDSMTSEIDLQPIKNFVDAKFQGANLREEYQGLLTYQIPQTDVPWSKLFGYMEEAKKRLNIEDYSLGQTSLEQVFLSFTKYQNNRNNNE